jgi:hypothetical protein
MIAVLEDKREIIRNGTVCDEHSLKFILTFMLSKEAITMVQALVSQSPDIQKVLAFEGAFEKLFNILTQEGGVDGGVVAQGALGCLDTLLRFNSSNQVSIHHPLRISFVTKAHSRVTSGKRPFHPFSLHFFNFLSR